ncbi:MAG: hypothetical protein PHS04_14985, partial [Tissierellia bacterium]|nr:hypothetical protein [Tissierellia bacterium]
MTDYFVCFVCLFVLIPGLRIRARLAIIAKAATLFTTRLGIINNKVGKLKKLKIKKEKNKNGKKG